MFYSEVRLYENLDESIIYPSLSEIARINFQAPSSKASITTFFNNPYPAHLRGVELDSVNYRLRSTTTDSTCRIKSAGTWIAPASSSTELVRGAWIPEMGMGTTSQFTLHISVWSNTPIRFSSFGPTRSASAPRGPSAADLIRILHRQAMSEA